MHTAFAAQWAAIGTKKGEPLPRWKERLAEIVSLRGAMAWGAIEVAGEVRHKAMGGITNAGRRAGATGD